MMRVVKADEHKKRISEGIRIVEKFLNHLDGISSVSRNTHGKNGADLSFVFGKNRTGTITVVADKNHSENFFAETYVTEAGVEPNELTAKPGELYTNQSDFLFYLVGNILYTLPLKKFRKWIDTNTEFFRSECTVVSGQGNRERKHGLLVPAERIRREFAKGNINVSIYQLIDNPNSENEIDFIQEL